MKQLSQNLNEIEFDCKIDQKIDLDAISSVDFQLTCDCNGFKATNDHLLMYNHPWEDMHFYNKWGNKFNAEVKNDYLKSIINETATLDQEEMTNYITDYIDCLSRPIKITAIKRNVVYLTTVKNIDYDNKYLEHFYLSNDHIIYNGNAYSKFKKMKNCSTCLPDVFLAFDLDINPKHNYHFKRKVGGNSLEVLPLAVSILIGMGYHCDLIVNNETFVYYDKRVKNNPRSFFKYLIVLTGSINYHVEVYKSVTILEKPIILKNYVNIDSFADLIPGNLGVIENKNKNKNKVQKYIRKVKALVLVNEIMSIKKEVHEPKITLQGLNCFLKNKQTSEERLIYLKMKAEDFVCLKYTCDNDYDSEVEFNYTANIEVRLGKKNLKKEVENKKCKEKKDIAQTKEKEEKKKKREEVIKPAKLNNKIRNNKSELKMLHKKQQQVEARKQESKRFKENKELILNMENEKKSRETSKKENENKQKQRKFREIESRKERESENIMEIVEMNLRLFKLIRFDNYSDLIIKNKKICPRSFEFAHKDEKILSCVIDIIDNFSETNRVYVKYVNNLLNQTRLITVVVKPKYFSIGFYKSDYKRGKLRNMTLGLNKEQSTLLRKLNSQREDYCFFYTHTYLKDFYLSKKDILGKEKLTKRMCALIIVNEYIKKSNSFLTITKEQNKETKHTEITYLRRLLVFNLNIEDKVIMLNKIKTLPKGLNNIAVDKLVLLNSLSKFNTDFLSNLNNFAKIKKDKTILNWVSYEYRLKTEIENGCKKLKKITVEERTLPQWVKFSKFILKEDMACELLVEHKLNKCETVIKNNWYQDVWYFKKIKRMERLPFLASIKPTKNLMSIYLIKKEKNTIKDWVRDTYIISKGKYPFLDEVKKSFLENFWWNKLDSHHFYSKLKKWVIDEYVTYHANIIKIIAKISKFDKTKVQEVSSWCITKIRKLKVCRDLVSIFTCIKIYLRPKKKNLMSLLLVNGFFPDEFSFINLKLLFLQQLVSNGFFPDINLSVYYK